MVTSRDSTDPPAILAISVRGAIYSGKRERRPRPWRRPVVLPTPDPTLDQALLDGWFEMTSYVEQVQWPTHFLPPDDDPEDAE